MGPARPCIGDSSRGLGALDERRDVGPGFLAPGRTVRRGVCGGFSAWISDCEEPPRPAFGPAVW